MVEDHAMATPTASAMTSAGARTRAPTMARADETGSLPHDPSRSGVAIGGAMAVGPRCLPTIRHRVNALVRAHDVGPGTAWRIDRAVTEAVGNVVAHACRDGGGQVRYAADAVDGHIEVLIGDDGGGIRDEPSDGLGLGQAIIARCADDFAIGDRRSGGLEVWMRFIVH
jgi:anti-sigma regulatory factor (Ser/Thr protein kinase)